MNIAYYVVIVLHVVVCLFLIAVVLLQQGRGQDLASAFGGGGTQTAFGPRGSANVLSRATTILAALFIMTSLALSLLRPGVSVLSGLPAPASSPAAKATPSPAASAAAPAPTATHSPR